jgi:hypothetical protein
MQTTVKSTKELREFFPELSAKDRFRTKIDQVFELGYSFEVETKEPLKCFTAKNRKMYKSRILYNGSGFLLKKTYLQKSSTTLQHYNNCPEKFTMIADKPSGSIKFGNADPVDTYHAEYEVTENTSWGILGRAIGKMIKNELINVCTCSKCNGTGFLPHFAYYADGVCFECLGVGKWLEVNK